MGTGVGLGQEEEAEVRAFLALREEPRLGDRGIGALVERFGSGVQALRARGRQLSFCDPGPDPPDFRGWEREGIRVLPMTSERYPKLLRQLSDPPPIIFFRGRSELLSRPSVAIVGSRKATEAGRRTATNLAMILSAAGITVVSGMALGIDGAAHRGALKGVGGTVAVLGSGLRVVYPRAHRTLFKELGSKGLVLSEFLPEEKALPHHFPRRNRIIAALSQAVIVVEAGRKSGALITVDHGLDLGREVLAVPGSVQNPQAAGSNGLLREGARVVADPEAILEELRALGLSVPNPEGSYTGSNQHPPGIPSELAGIWAVLPGSPLGVEQIAKEADMSFPEALAGLSALEMGGWAEGCPGMRFRRR